MENLEDIVMAHRYLYYVEASPVVSDFIYDAFERDARRELPETSPVHGIGSSLPSDYSDYHIALAKKLLENS